MSKFTYFFLVFLSFSFNVNAQCDDRYNEPLSDTFVLHQNIIYGSNTTSDGDSIDLTMDIFEPAFASENPRPVIILAHGGGFFDGSKEMAEVVWFCEDFAKRGFVTASINYRKEASVLSLIDREKMIKAVIRATEDYKASIRYFHRSAAEGNPYNINSELIIVGGTSAGSIAALHSVFMDEFYKLPSNYQGWIVELSGDTTLVGTSGNLGFSDDIAGVINISGALISPSHMDDDAHIPIFNSHNTVDLTVPYRYGYPYQIPLLPILAGSLPIHNKMEEIGGYSVLYPVNELNHVPHTKFDGSKNEEVYTTMMRKMARFLRYVIPCTELPTSFNTNIVQPFTVFPNPAKDILEIKGLENINNYDFKLIDVSGKVIESELQVNNEKVVLQSSLNGIYFLVGTNTITSEMATSKVLIQN
ncbi:MAG: T9SS type A sorting domain-containing protein [Chitinophagales bacterium]